MADTERKVEACETNSLPGRKEITNNDTVGASGNPEIEDVEGDKSQDSIISPYRICDENAFELAPNVSKRGSNVFQGKARLCEAGKQSSGERMTVSEVSGESEKMPVKSSDTYPVVIGEGTKGKESSDTSVTRLSKDGVDKLDSVSAVFDLNEDINEDGTDEFIQPDVETVSPCTVIKVVAKAGVPRGVPTTPLKFEGGRNWKGSVEMSAFRSVGLPSRFSSELCSKKRYGSRGFTGIDLNVAAVEEPSSAKEHLCSDVGSKRAKSLSNDLNFLHGDANGMSRNAYTCKQVTSKNFQWLGLGHEALGNKTSDHYSTNPGNEEIDLISRASLTDWSAMQQEQDANHTHSKEYLVAAKTVPQPMELLQRAAPWQPKIPCISWTLPPQNHFLKVPFSQNHVPYSYHPQEHGNLVQIISGQNPANKAISMPPVDAKAKASIPTSGIRMGEAAPFIFLTCNPMDDHIKSINQETWYATLAKMQEPGGINYHQLGYRQDI